MERKLGGKLHSGKSFRSSQAGFSLVELMVAIAIMIVLTGITAPNFYKYVEKNRAKACKQNREAVLNIYSRSVFDSSTTIGLTTEDLEKFIPKAGNADNIYKPAQYELRQFSQMPNKHAYGTVKVDATTGTAYIECDECKAHPEYATGIVSIDMFGFAKKEYEEVMDDVPPTPSPAAPSPSAAIEWEVNFYLNDGSSNTYGDAVTVENGKTVSRPAGNPTRNALYNFVCWCTDKSGKNEFDFGTAITKDTDLYAKWAGVKRGEIWPYADDTSWWDSSLFTHGDEVVAMNLSGTSNNMYITLKSPSGIFTSLAGGQFVYVNENNDQKIYFYEAMTPEYYSALHPAWLIQLTGHTVNVNLFDETGKDKNTIKVNNVTNGDLVHFINADGSYYEYVYWHSQEDFTYTVSDIRQYRMKLGNMLRVSREY